MFDVILARTENLIWEMITQMIWDQILLNKGMMTEMYPWTSIWT